MSQELVCPNCDRVVREQNVNPGRMVAVCPACDTVFKFGDTQAAPAKRKRHPVKPSKALRVFDKTLSEGFEIHFRKPAGGQHVFLVLFTLFWNGFMVVWFWITLSTGEYAMAAFGSIHGAVGVGLAYWLLSIYLSKTRIIVSPSQVQVETVRVFSRTLREFNTASISQLFVRRATDDVNDLPNYEVHIEIPSEGKRRLIGGLENPADALFIEGEIEAYLGIPDRVVPGEYASENYY